MLFKDGTRSSLLSSASLVSCLSTLAFDISTFVTAFPFLLISYWGSLTDNGPSGYPSLFGWIVVMWPHLRLWVSPMSFILCSLDFLLKQVCGLTQSFTLYIGENLVEFFSHHSRSFENILNKNNLICVIHLLLLLEQC